MAYHTSPATSDSPSPTSSTQVSPHIRTTPLDSMLDDDSPTSGEGTPHRSAINLPRTQTSGKGGCWTCRVRRKKCDEVREDGSCKTCKRLTIQCLGWGAKRPEWMRDKKNVDAYKASIKAQLSRAGLIRGQPRPQPLPVPPRIVSSTRPSKPTSAEVVPQPLESPQPPPRIVPSSTPAEPQPPSPFDAISAAAYDPFDPSASFHYQAALSNGAPYGTSLIPDLLADPSYSLFAGTDPLAFLDPSPIVPNHPNPSELDHYFNHVHQFQFAFASDLLTDVTYTATMNDHQGAVTLAICALAQLHSKQERISQGLELPNLVPDSSSGSYLVTEALMKLDNNHSINRSWQESDALAALYLVRLSQISGGGCDWEHPFNIMCQWLTQHNLHTSDNTWHAFLNISALSQLLAKFTLWLDVFVSLSRQRPPKFFILLQRLLAEQQNFWANGSEQHGPHRLRMDLLTGCPDEVLLAIAEVSNLAHWKASQIRNGCLSYPELIRQGTAIEHRLRRAPSDLSRHDRQTSTVGPTREQRAQVANIFKETARLYLHTVMSNSAPGVPEIKVSVDTIMRLFSQLAPGPVDRALVFPICFAGCMTNDSNRREFMKNRIMSLDEGFGNSMQTRRLMEAVWQQRDVGNKEVDIREIIQEQGLNLLLI